jgi:hypothetical protein
MLTLVSLKIEPLRSLLQCPVNPIYEHEALIAFVTGDDLSLTRFKELGLADTGVTYEDAASGKYLHNLTKEKDIRQLKKDVELATVLGAETLLVETRIIHYARERNNVLTA